MFNLTIITTHPIQYYAPFFQELAKEKKLNIKVFYTWGSKVLDDKFDPDFGKHIQWDIPLLEGYDYHFTKNIAKEPSSAHFKGIINPHLITEVEAEKPNAILIYGYAYQSHLKLIRYFKGKVPIWFRGDSTLLDKTAGWKFFLKRLYLNWVYKHIDKALYVGQHNRDYFLKYGVKENQLVFLPHAIDNQRFAEDRREEALNLRKKLGLKYSDILVLFAGKLEPKKNPEILLEAFIELNMEKVHLLYVGNGFLEKGLKSKVESKKLQNVYFMDFQNQAYMPVVYQACDLFCLPSKGPGETWGLAINEAMAAGKAVLVSDKAGCTKDLVKHKLNGLTFEAENLEDLKAKLEYQCIKKRLIDMGKESPELISNWSFSKQIELLTKLMDE
jgi:glycosyltransferase involved in cell wall biosynthesis